MPADLIVKSRLRIIKFWLPVLLCMSFIFYTSSVPGSNVPPLFPFQDIAFHLFIYLILGLFFARALKNTSSNVAPSKIILFTIIFGTIYGISDELHQLFVPDRCVSGLDILIDGVGSFVGSLTQPFFKI